jgi:hypothetical protein
MYNLLKLVGILNLIVEHDGHAVSVLRRAIAEVKQHCSVIGYVTKNLLSRAATAFAVVSTHQPALVRVVGYGSFFLCVTHKVCLCPSSGDINRLMMMTH